jgi:hypothetical protein
MDLGIQFLNSSIRQFLNPFKVQRENSSSVTVVFLFPVSLVPGFRRDDAVKGLFAALCSLLDRTMLRFSMTKNA